MKLFCEKTDELSEAFYFLTMLEAAVCFIQDINAKALRMSEREFQDYFSGAVPHHKPLRKENYANDKDQVGKIKLSFISREANSISIEEIPQLLDEYKKLAQFLK